MSLERLRETSVPNEKFGQLKANRWPDPAAASWQECREVLGQPLDASLIAWKSLGWRYDDVLLCWRWALNLLSEPERESVARAREACALEEATA